MALTSFYTKDIKKFSYKVAETEIGCNFRCVNLLYFNTEEGQKEFAQMKSAQKLLPFIIEVHLFLFYSDKDEKKEVVKAGLKREKQPREHLHYFEFYRKIYSKNNRNHLSKNQILKKFFLTLDEKMPKIKVLVVKKEREKKKSYQMILKIVSHHDITAIFKNSHQFKI